MVDDDAHADPRPGRTSDPHALARVALAHDWLCGYRGGEAVLERIAVVAARLGEIDRLYTMFDDRRPLASAIDRLEKCVSPLAALPDSWRRWLLPLYPAAVSWLSRRLEARQRRAPVDLVLSTSSVAVKGLRPPPGVPHVCYCHAPARYLWSVREEYAGGRSLKDRLRALGLGLAGSPFQAWDRATAANVTGFIANSTHTAGEIRRCFGREAEVLHPPARTEFFTPDPAVPREDFWLFVAALEPYKRADLAVRAARLAGANLVVVGRGSMERSLKARDEGRGVTFRGRISSDELRDLYRRARLLVFPQIEDFGIAAVEAQACGCPVVARRLGGALDTVIDGRTGRFFDGVEPEAIVAAAADCPSDAAPCRANAERFSESAFDRGIATIIERALLRR